VCIQIQDMIVVRHHMVDRQPPRQTRMFCEYRWLKLQRRLGLHGSVKLLAVTIRAPVLTAAPSRVPTSLHQRRDSLFQAGSQRLHPCIHRAPVIPRAINTSGQQHLGSGWQHMRSTRYWHRTWAVGMEKVRHEVRHHFPLLHIWLSAVHIVHLQRSAAVACTAVAATRCPTGEL